MHSHCHFQYRYLLRVIELTAMQNACTCVIMWGVKSHENSSEASRPHLNTSRSAEPRPSPRELVLRGSMPACESILTLFPALNVGQAVSLLSSCSQFHKSFSSCIRSHQHYQSMYLSRTPLAVYPIADFTQTLMCIQTYLQLQILC